MSEQVVAADVRIHGRVQGVFFRASMRAEAQRLGVHGRVRNEDDGSVGAHLEGAPDPVEALVAWCGRGPDAARVQRVEQEVTEVVGATSFGIAV